MLSNTEAELKKNIAYKKTCSCKSNIRNLQISCRFLQTNQQVTHHPVKTSIKGAGADLKYPDLK